LWSKSSKGRLLSAREEEKKMVSKRGLVVFWIVTSRGQKTEETAVGESAEEIRFRQESPNFFFPSHNTNSVTSTRTGKDENRWERKKGKWVVYLLDGKGVPTKSLHLVRVSLART
jgi:hypothetical protein